MEDLEEYKTLIGSLCGVGWGAVCFFHRKHLFVLMHDPVWGPFIFPPRPPYCCECMRDICKDEFIYEAPPAQSIVLHCSRIRITLYAFASAGRLLNRASCY